MALSKSDKTRQHIIEKSAPFFNRKGYADTSMMDIVAATGLTKGAIYGNFENKNELSLAVFEYNLGLLRHGVQAAMQEKSDSLEKLKAMTGHFRKEFKPLALRGGCPILNAATEADDNFPRLKVRVKAALRSWKNELIRIIENGKQAKLIHKTVNAEKYAALFISIIEGGIMLAKTLDDASHFYHNLDHINLLIDKELAI